MRAALGAGPALLSALALACGSASDGAPSDQDSSAEVAEADAAERSDANDAVEVDAGPSGPQPLTVMTFNVLCSFCDPDAAYDPWVDRLDAFADIFARHDPDLLGLQELAFPEEVAEIEALLPGFLALWYDTPHPNDVLDGYPDALLMVRESRFEVLEQGSYWLSPTPDEPWTTGFADQQLWRLLVWAKLEERESGRVLFVASTHFDNNAPSQDESAPLMVERAQAWMSEAPFIALGDYNCRPGDTAYAALLAAGSAGHALEDAYELAESPRLGTNQEAPAPWDPEGRIDHILAGPAGAFTALDWVVDLSVYGPKDRFPSDHWPVVATLALQPE